MISFTVDRTKLRNLFIVTTATVEGYSRGHLLYFPAELLVYILIKAEPVQTVFHSAITSSVQLQYKIGLDAEGLLDGFASPSCSIDRLNLLQLCKRWLTLD
ncbi:hypothetical protein AcV5_001602 [Taiwanofungus camphoratus]|nr:hypothetical protein AcV5_001602 [Antrodia cinnamomea]